MCVFCLWKLVMSHWAYGLWVACPNWTPEKGQGLESDSDPQVFTLTGKVVTEGPEHDEGQEAPVLCPVPERPGW